MLYESVAIQPFLTYENSNLTCFSLHVSKPSFIYLFYKYLVITKQVQVEEEQREGRVDGTNGTERS